MAGLVMLLGAQAALASEHDVTTTADTGTGSLRDAITAANADSSPPVVVKITATGTLTLGSELPDLTNDMTITGPGSAKFTIDGGGSFRGFNVASAKTVSLSGLTIDHGMGGTVAGGGGGIVNFGVLTLDDVTVSNSSSTVNGGGIENNANATIRNSTISGNTATNLGGGIEDNGRLTVERTTISGNTANVNGTGTGAGIDVEQNQTLTMTDSTVTGNMTPGNGAGLRVEGTATVERSTFTNNQAGGFAGGIGVTNQAEEGFGGTLTLRNSTVTGNSATVNGGGLGIYGTGTVISSTIATNTSATGANVNVTASGTFQNTIVAYPQGLGANCAQSGGTLASNGNNLEDDMAKSCNFTQASDQAGPDPKLGSLTDNGGPTQTRKLLNGSPAIDKGTAAGLVANQAGQVTDQRGVVRPVGPQADIGAVELAPPTAVTGVAGPIAGHSATIAGTATNPHLDNGSAYFLYGKGSNPTGSTSATRVVHGGTSNLAVSVPLSGLQSDTTYHFRLVVTNADGTSTGADHTFKTPKTPPHASTGGAFNVKDTSAHVRGHVNPEGVPTTFRIEYGTDTTYGHKTSPSSAGAGTQNLPVTAKLTGLSPATTYHYRVTANSSQGSAQGRDRTFTTKGAPPTITHTHFTSVGSDDARLETTIDPNGSSTSYTVDCHAIGPAGLRITRSMHMARGRFHENARLRKSSTASGDVGSGNTPITIVITLTDLAPNTTYECQVHASNKFGSADSQKKTFRTQSGENDTDGDD